MQVKLSLFFLKSPLFLPFLPHFIAAEGFIHQNDVVSEPLDAVPRDIIVLSPAEQSEKSAGAKDDDGLHCPLGETQLNIPHIPQAAAVTEIDDLLAPQLAEFYKHISHLATIVCAAPLVPFRRFGTLFAVENNHTSPRTNSPQTKDGGKVMRGKVEICGINTAELKVLKNEEMVALLKRLRQGDESAREALICGNLRLVLSVIQRFAGRGENVDDLFQVGCIGLMKAIDNFDVEQGVRFSTYGVPMIAGEIRRYLRDNSAIRVSRSVRDTAYRVLQAREALMAQDQREPSVEQIARYLDLPREEVVMAMDAVVDPISLYEPLYDQAGDTVCVMDQVKDNANTAEHWLDHLSLKEAIGKLDPRQRRILAMRFYQGKTQMETAAEIGISQAQVSRLEKGAIACIKREL